MSYLKYLELDGRDLVIFDGGWAHAAVAKQLSVGVVSAGLVSATLADDPARCGSFFADSLTLRLSSDPSLRLDEKAWFAGSKHATRLWSTSKECVRMLSGEDALSSELTEVDGYWCLTHPQLSPNGALLRFLP